MPAIPLIQPGLSTPLPEGPQIFERGDKIILVSKVQAFTPTDSQIEELAFSTQVKKSAPNDNITWFKGQYVEADNQNKNGAQWTANELAIKSLTPMLMPVTVMHDPRTAVGVIADTKLLTPDADTVARARIDTVLALWSHRFPEAVREAEFNAAAGTLMQSMECFSPWYSCSECGEVFHKLPHSAEQASWCSHLKQSNPSAGYTNSADSTQPGQASRVLGDVTFTGTGLIYGTRGAQGAYTEAYLERFEDEVASYHQYVHTATATNPTPRSDTRMALVQIEESELATLRKERDDAKADRDRIAAEKATAEQSVETAEQAKAAAERERDDIKSERDSLQEATAKAELKTRRMDALAPTFIAKLGDFTKTRLHDQAQAMSDEDWDGRLKELEEAYGVKRDAEGEGGKGGEQAGAGDGTLFTQEEVAKARVATPPSTPSAPARQEVSSVVGSLAGAFSKR